jgi:DNA-directed RNA polymerase subunit RPC12/RpoP
MRDEFFEAQFKSHSDDSVVQCPYCKYEYQPEAEDYSEDTREHECSECEKKFWLHQNFEVSHHVKPDCELNGEQHKWDFIRKRGGIDTQWQSCDVCDKWRRTPSSAAGERDEQ